MVGYSDGISGTPTACLWQNNTITNLGTLPGYEYSEALGINDSGQVVGWARSSTDAFTACLWQNGTIINLGSGYAGSAALGINDGGEVVGWAGNSGPASAVSWTPVPEPSSVLALLCGIGGLASLGWRRR